jgi:DNA-binding transcriptional ArsR family regulator
MKPMAFDTTDVLFAARMKALAHPARLTIVRALLEVADGGCCCGDIVGRLPLAQSTVSQHLKVLRQAGLVRGEVSGPRSCYWLDREALASVGEALKGLGRGAARRAAAVRR